MKKVLFGIVSCFVCMLVASGVFAEDIYVQSVKAKIMSAPSFKSTIIATVVKGQKLVSLGKDKNWAKVQFESKEGYISSLLLSSQPPMDKVGLIKADDGDIKQGGVRRRASTYTSAAAARGLAQDDRRRMSKEEKVDYDSLDKIESFTVSQEEVAKFVEATR